MRKPFTDLFGPAPAAHDPVGRVRQLIADLWESWRVNRHHGRREQERAFWAGYALGRRQAARQLANAIGAPELMRQPATEPQPWEPPHGK